MNVIGLYLNLLVIITNAYQFLDSIASLIMLSSMLLITMMSVNRTFKIKWEEPADQRVTSSDDVILHHFLMISYMYLHILQNCLLSVVKY